VKHAWILDAPRLTGDVANLLARLVAAAQGEPVAFGIDCPIGLPRAYAEQLKGFHNFPAFLKGLHPDAPFFQVAETIEQVSLARPFYPAGSVSGPGHKQALARALGLADVGAMSRQVDRQTRHRPAAGQLFWTLGANQCGKAALGAWRDLLLPAFETLQVRLWPFDGAFRELVRPGQIVVAETYPAEALRQLGLRLEGSKQSQEARQGVAGPILGVLERLGVRPAMELSVAIASGFGAKATGEDAFDSLVGALCMINVLHGFRPDVPPLPVDEWEGWVLGQIDLPVAVAETAGAPSARES
jgi:hypothetical protein